MPVFRKRFALFSPEGDASAAGGAAAPAAAAPAAGGDPAAAAAPAASGAPAAAAAGSDNSPSSWLQSIADADLKTYAEGKGFKDAGEAFKALRETESKFTAPAKVEDYQIGDGEFAKTAATWFHEAGVPAEMAKTLTSKWNAFVEQQNTDADTARQQKGEQEMAGLKTEWGDGNDKNMEYARGAMRTFGVPVDMIDQLSGKMGDAAVVKMFSKIGSSLSEGTLNPGGAGGSGAALTEEQRAAKFYSSAKS